MAHMQRSVLLGEYDFTLDAKNRVAIPARLRPAFAEGVFITRGFENCIAVYPPEEWDRFVADAHGRPARDERRRAQDAPLHLRRRPLNDQLDGQGRIKVPANLLEFSGVEPRRHHHRRPGPHRDLGPCRVGALSQADGGGGRCCRNQLAVSEYEMALAHMPVLLDELVELLKPAPGEKAFDATFGAGGHAAAVAERLGSDGLLIACDRDPTVAEYFRDFARQAPCRTELYHGDFAEVLADYDDASFDIVYMDLGVSSMQLDRRERGFSYAYDAPLDMRMDTAQDVTAADLVNTLSADELTDVFRRYGEERYAKDIARRIERERIRTPFTTTGQLVDVIKCAIPTPARFGAGNPARRVFQALRIVVNNELESLAQGLEEGYRVLRPGGRLAAISFHSLEDRMVKEYFKGHGAGLHLSSGSADLRLRSRADHARADPATDHAACA